MKGVVKILLIVIGSISVLLGIAGIFLPLLPTTPFLLLAAFCYSRSSDRFYHWLITNRWFGEYISNYRAGLGIALKQKIVALSLLWLTMSYSIWFVVSQWWVQLLLLGIAVAVTIHLVRMKTFRPEQQETELPVEYSSSKEAD